MKHFAIFSWLVLALLWLTACQPMSQTPTKTAQTPTEANILAAQAMQDFHHRLQSTMTSHMQAGGPVAAVNFCHDEAPGIAEAVSKQYGVRLGRVPMPGKQRNPNNVIEPWQADVLAAFQHNVDAGQAADQQVHQQHQNLPEGVALRTMKGIAMQGKCLMCHGEHIPPTIQTVLDTHYPDDRAHGFREGDLRGAMWVEVPSTH